MADAALIPTPQIVSRVQSANIFRLLLVIGFFPFLFSVCRSFQTIARSITSNAKRTPKPTLAARVELAPTKATLVLAAPRINLPVRTISLTDTNFQELCHRISLILTTYSGTICKPTPTKGGNVFGKMQVTKLLELSKLETVDEAVAKLLEFAE